MKKSKNIVWKSNIWGTYVRAVHGPLPNVITNPIQRVKNTIKATKHAKKYYKTNAGGSFLTRLHNWVALQLLRLGEWFGINGQGYL